MKQLLALIVVSEQQSMIPFTPLILINSTVARAPLRINLEQPRAKQIISSEFEAFLRHESEAQRGFFV